MTHSMDGYQTDIQALLRDINDNYGSPKHEQAPQPPPPSSRPISNFYTFQAQRCVVPRNALAPIPEQKLHYEAKASRLLDANSYSILSDNDLDPYGNRLELQIEERPADCCLDQALLDEPEPRSPWQANSSVRTLPAGPPSLQCHRAPYPSVEALEQPKAQKQRRGRSSRVLPVFRC